MSARCTLENHFGRLTSHKFIILFITLKSWQSCVISSTLILVFIPLLTLPSFLLKWGKESCASSSLPSLNHRFLSLNELLRDNCSFRTVLADTSASWMTFSQAPVRFNITEGDIHSQSSNLMTLVSTNFRSSYDVNCTAQHCKMSIVTVCSKLQGSRTTERHTRFR